MRWIRSLAIGFSATLGAAFVLIVILVMVVSLITHSHGNDPSYGDGVAWVGVMMFPAFAPVAALLCLLAGVLAFFRSFES